MNKKGSVLLIVLIIVTAALAISLGISEKNTDIYSKVTTMQNQYQAETYAYTIAKAAAEIIKEDDNKYDSLKDDWANSISYPTDEGFIEVSITPLNKKVDLNAFTLNNKILNERIINYYNVIVSENNLDTNIIYLIKDYVDNDTEITSYGNENQPIIKFGRVLSVKNDFLDTLYEINYTNENFDNKTYNILKRFFTASNGEKKININFATADTIKYFLPEIADYADAIVKYRESKPYKDISAIRKAAEIPNDVYQKIIPYITVKSNRFYLKITIDNFGNLFYYHVLIDRKKGVLLFFEGANEDYF
ncbi:hypothetical protein DEFDS_1315 [Deferribacter desulfuricans SSM1]|uniref:General secretion pathway protein K n=1 Tax=Deferribacter desulfuricans (strain DSM 14783 / JCM 11476 / NBRC 101012 / SSM1) TaxID=639282 RepID=D3PDV9_DEFDS|nr:helix-hairpin-helix domain-containing protein [Deferribacter desulfuricans]BAI80782.1 hypothetical protein DEFDS_1315 [Deferribacter desulfuricans SSM1]